MSVEEGREVEATPESTARQQAEKDQLEKAQKEKDPKPADHIETDKEQAQKWGDATERKSAQPRGTPRSPPDGAR
jgi:hypothetical protein